MGIMVQPKIMFPANSDRHMPKMVGIGHTDDDINKVLDLPLESETNDAEC